MKDIEFEIYQDSIGEFRWRAIAGNGERMANSGEGYTRKADAERARDRFVELVKRLP